jgi:hypothetical protein
MMIKCQVKFKDLLKSTASLRLANVRVCTAAALSGVFSVLVANSAGAQSSSAPEIWLQPNSHYEVQAFKNAQPRADWSQTGSDFWSFFSSSSNDSSVVSKIKVIKLSPAFVAGASKDELQRVYGWLSSHQIQLAVGVEMLDPNFGRCGRGVEGFSAGLEGYLSKLRSTGVSVSYFIMDEPLFFGSEAKFPNACQASFLSTAENILASARKIKAFFPNAQIGEIEPIPQTTGLASWLDTYRQIMGEYPSVFIADVSWRQVTDNQLQTWSSLTRQRHIKFGIIFNAANTPNNQAWEDTTLNNAKRAGKILTKNVDIALFQSWIAQPAKLLPTGQYGTMSNTIEHYAQQN